MYAADLRGAIARRWYLVLLGALLTAGLCALALKAFPLTYRAQANVVFLPPANAVGDTANPYLSLGGLDTATGVVATAMTDAQTVKRLQAGGVDHGFTVDRDLTTGGPVLLVTADGTTPAAAQSALGVVMQQLPVVLKKLQTEAGAPEQSLIVSQVITKDAQATPVRKSQLRGLILALGLGVGGTLLLVSLLDRLLLRRRQRGSGQDDSDAQAPVHLTQLAARGRREPERGSGTEGATGTRR